MAPNPERLLAAKALTSNPSAVKRFARRFKVKELTRAEKLVRAGLPLPLALQRISTKRRVRFSPLSKFFLSRLKPETRLQLKKASIVLRPAELIGLENRKHIASLATVRFFVYPTKEMRVEIPVLGTHLKRDVGSLAFGEEARTGSFAEIDAGLINFNGGLALFVPNAQARGRFYDVPGGKRTKFRDWYEPTLSALMKQVGVKQIVIASNEMINANLQENYPGHLTLGPSVLDPFYNGFAASRGFTLVNLTLPTSTGPRTGTFWVRKEPL